MASINLVEENHLLVRKENTQNEAVEEGKRVFEMPAGIISILFEEKRDKTKRLEKSDWQKDIPLVSFLNGKILTVGDFEENNKSEPSSYWP